MRLTNEGIEFRDSLFTVTVNFILAIMFICLAVLLLSERRFLFAGFFIVLDIVVISGSLSHILSGRPLLKITPQGLYYKGSNPILLEDITSVNTLVKKRKNSKIFSILIEVKDPASYTTFNRKLIRHGAQNVFSFNVSALSKEDRERLLAELSNILPNIYVAKEFK